ncbi:ABC transporter ATP-binding protein [Paenibacillus pinisoli]|uniref:ABC transporter ATP-binding protein n=1 Tax=Paenibacillus pinisoli TaxID=1276110 RepID=A0A3A6PG97_9BACL|nr:ABC transporter ATP-binding protein [Paenibacillus pinisoli]
MKLSQIIRKMLTGSYWTIAILSLLSVILIGIAAYTIKLTEQFFDALTNSNHHYSFIIQLIVIMLLLKLTQLCMEQLRQYLEQKMSIQMNRLLEYQLIDLIHLKTVTKLETPQYQNDFNFLKSTFFSISSLIITFIHFAHQIILFMTYSIILINYMWYIPIIVSIYCLPHFLNEIKISKLNHSYTENTSQLTREKLMMFETLVRPLAQKELLIFQSKSFFLRKWDKVSLKSIKWEISHQKKIYIKRLLFAIIEPLGFVIIQILLVRSLIASELSIGQYIAITTAVTMLQSALFAIGQYFGRVKQTFLTSRQLQQFMEKYFPLSLTGQAHDRKLASPIEEIMIKNLTFQYPTTNRYVLKHINLNIKAGHCISIVGENGSGKSTLGKILIGLYDVAPGALYINDTDINEIDHLSLIRQMTMVSQDFVRYPISLEENIILNSPSEESNKNLLELSEKYPELFPEEVSKETILGWEFTGSRQLSGGQWQKIAIARALYKNSPFLLLDEATSALDPETEQSIMNSIVKNRKRAGQTTLFITHRMQICQMADYIIVLHNGEIAESGTHQELIQAGGRYYRMFATTQDNNEVNNSGENQLQGTVSAQFAAQS